MALIKINTVEKKLAASTQSLICKNLLGSKAVERLDINETESYAAIKKKILYSI
ncbi:hypothetical protein A3Q56_08092 [Intoshia linei]|uniref:Uncharacterized protein n=1 Tax=Intoshia linei TaxID=1819745 RepID=A0A177AQC7_9BILA|nr:hypothetical protein A3Q56_08092 [Intoshia linei]